MSSNTNSAIQNANSTGNFSVSGSGDNDKITISSAAPIYSSGNCTVSIGSGYSGSYDGHGVRSIGAGITWKHY